LIVYTYSQMVYEYLKRIDPFFLNNNDTDTAACRDIILNVQT